MKILILSSKVPFPPHDGGAIATLNMTAGLLAAGADVTLLAMNTGKHPYCESVHGKWIPPGLKFSCVKINTAIRPVHAAMNLVFSDMPYQLTRFRSGSFRKSLIGLLRQQSFDLVQLEGLPPCLYIGDIRNNSTCRLALRAHNVEHKIWEGIYRELPFGMKKMYTLVLARRLQEFESVIARSVDYLIPVSEHDAHFFREKGGGKRIRVVPAGLDPGKYIPATPGAGTPALFFLGALDWLPNRQGLQWFVENVWPGLKRTHPDLLLRIAGRNAPAGLVRKLAGGNIEFLGELDDATEFINRNHIWIIPLFAGSGIRIKILEGMALGKAIVATSLAAQGLPVIHDRHLLIADTAEQFIRTLDRLLREHDIMKRLAKEARTLVVEEYDNRRLTEGLYRFYTESL